MRSSGETRSLECETHLNMLRRTVHEYAPLRDDPVIRRMGLPDDPELEGLVERVVDRVRRHWLWKVCPAAMYSQEYERLLRTMGYHVLLGDAFNAEDRRERRHFSRAKTPQRRHRLSDSVDVLGVNLPGDGRTEEDHDEVGLFQSLPRPHWQGLIDQLGAWFEEGREVGMAIRMARRMQLIGTTIAVIGSG